MALIGLSEVAAMLKVSRERAAQIIAAYSDFPVPVAVVGARRGWDPAQVEQWQSEHPDRPPGRPRKQLDEGG